MRARYVNISIPEELAKKIDKFMKTSKLGYRSRAEVVSEALRILFLLSEKVLKEDQKIYK